MTLMQTGRGASSPPLTDETLTPKEKKKAAQHVRHRSVISDLDHERRLVSITFRVTRVVVFLCLLIGGAGPLLWLAKSATSTSQDILREPFALWPSGLRLENLANAWVDGGIGPAMFNTGAIAAGSVIANLVVSIMAAYVLSVLRPRWAPVLSGLILVTLFVPGVISLVPQYLVIVSVPGLGVSLLDTFWATWLPASTSAFTILIIKRYFDGISPQLFDAARVDGAGPIRVLSLIVYPLSRPILGAVALISFMTAWKDFLWPLLVLPSPERQPVSVRLHRLEDEADLATLMGGLLLAVIVPVVLFVIFQRQLLRGVSLSGGIKG